MEHNNVLVLVVLSIVVTSTFGDQLQCKNPYGQPVDWFIAIKLPNYKLSNGTPYVYLDAENLEWTYFPDITVDISAIGFTVSQIYAPTNNYNETIMWITYNDEPSNMKTSNTKGHSKGLIAADNNTGFWLVHSVPKFPQIPYQNNFYKYPKTGVKFGQSFLCISMMANELDQVGNQLTNNEVLVYGSHFGGFLKETYPGLYNATLPHNRSTKDNDGVRLQDLKSINGFKFLSISKNRHFEKDLYEDLITHMTHSNLYTETWLNSRDRFNSSCSEEYKTLNIKSLVMKDINGMLTYTYKSSKDHSKWMITGKSSVPWTCIGDINRSHKQTERGGGTVCLDSIQVWSQFKKLVSDIQKCKKQ